MNLGRINWHGGDAKAKPCSQLAKHIGGKILALRQKHQASLRAVSEGTGLSAPFLCDLENGKREPGVGTLLRLSKYFGVRIQHFVNGHDL